jgi:hypothetical protein
MGNIILVSGHSDAVADRLVDEALRILGFLSHLDTSGDKALGIKLIVSFKSRSDGFESNLDTHSELAHFESILFTEYLANT